MGLEAASQSEFSGKPLTMTPYVFFTMVLTFSLVLFGFGIIIGRKRREVLDEAERFSLRMGSELAFAGALFALLPFPLYFISSVEGSTYGMASLLLATYFLMQTVRVGFKIIQYQAHWPAAVGFLLVLSVVFSTIEMLNALITRGLVWYAWGLIWLLILSGLQTLAFIFYDRRLIDDSNDIAPVDEHHRVVADRMRGNRGTGRADSPANGNRYANGNGLSHSRLERYRDRNGLSNADHTDWRPLTNAPVRPDSYRRRR